MGYRGEEWSRARLSFLTRLNERRESLRSSRNNPLVLVLPAAERTRVKELVPDLWAIRDFSLETAAWLPTDSEAPRMIRQEPPPPLLLTAFDKSLIGEWERLEKKKTLEHGFLLAADRAFQACLRTGNLGLASRIAKSQEGTARKRYRQLGETSETLWDLSVALGNVGDVERTLGYIGKAAEVYAESLNIRCRIAERYGETTQALRDLSVVQEKVRMTERGSGAGQGAKCNTSGDGSRTVPAKNRMEKTNVWQHYVKTNGTV